MKIKLTCLIAVIGLCNPLNAQSIKDLDFLIGTWKINETIYPGQDKSWTENGERKCEYYLNDSFIKCESETIDIRSGKSRYYTYLINYDNKEKCFWVTSLANDFPLHGKHKWFLNKEKKLINAISPINVIEDRFFRGTISYENPKQLVWNGWASKYLYDKEWEHVFEDITERE